MTQYVMNAIILSFYKYISCPGCHGRGCHGGVMVAIDAMVEANNILNAIAVFLYFVTDFCISLTQYSLLFQESQPMCHVNYLWRV